MASRGGSEGRIAILIDGQNSLPSLGLARAGRSQVFRPFTMQGTRGHVDQPEYERCGTKTQSTSPEATLLPTNLTPGDVLLWSPLGLGPLPGQKKFVFSSQGHPPCRQRACLLPVPWDTSLGLEEAPVPSPRVKEREQAEIPSICAESHTLSTAEGPSGE